MISNWSFVCTRKRLEDILSRLKKVLRTSPERRLNGVLEKVVATSISNQSQTSLRPRLRYFYNIVAMFLCQLGSVLSSNALLIFELLAITKQNEILRSKIRLYM